MGRHGHHGQGGPPWRHAGKRGPWARHDGPFREGPCRPGEHRGKCRGRDKRWSLRKQLFVWFVVAIVASAAAVSAVFSVLGASEWREQTSRVERFARGRFDAVWDVPPAREELADAIEHDLELGVSLFDAEGRALRTSEMPCSTHRHGPHGPIRIARADGSRIEICIPGPPHGPGRLIAGLVAAFFVLMGLSGALARKLGRPILHIAGVARELGEGDLAARVRPIPKQKEAAILAKLLNRMATRVESQLNDQRELLAGVSHELRTPLGHIRVLLELAQEGLLDERAICELEREVDAMDRLVGALLARSRLDFARVDPTGLDAALVAARALERQGLDPTLLDAPDDPLHVIADPTLVDQALANLLENAKVHGEGVAALRVSSGRELADAVRFEILDRGPGFEASAFEAFVASPGEGHSGSNGSQSTHPSLGLGLALVSRIARAHGGAVGVDPPPAGERGARVWLELPSEPDEIADADHLGLALESEPPHEQGRAD